MAVRQWNGSRSAWTVDFISSLLLQIDPIGIQLVPEETKIFRGWQVHFHDLRSELKLEPGFRQHTLHADPGHQFDDAKGARDWVVFHHSQIGHHADGELLAQSRPFPPSGAVEKSRAGDVVTPLRKPSPLMMSDNEQAPTVRGHIVAAPAAGQPPPPAARTADLRSVHVTVAGEFGRG